MFRKIADLGGFLTYLSLMAVMAFFLVFGVATFVVTLIDWLGIKSG